MKSMDLYVHKTSEKRESGPKSFFSPPALPPTSLRSSSNGGGGKGGEVLYSSSWFQVGGVESLYVGSLLCCPAAQTKHSISLALSPSAPE